MLRHGDGIAVTHPSHSTSRNLEAWSVRRRTVHESRPTMSAGQTAGNVMTGARTVTCSGDSVSLKQVADPNLLVAKASDQDGAGLCVQHPFATVPQAF